MAKTFELIYLNAFLTLSLNFYFMLWPTAWLDPGGSSFIANMVVTQKNQFSFKVYLLICLALVGAMVIFAAK